MRMENPWILGACRQSEVPGNNLQTFLQEQDGQLGEDLILESLLKSVFARRGRPLASVRYLEIGANHPIQTSNSYLFHQKWGGSGVLVEANSRLIPALQKVRRRDTVLHRAVVPAGFPEQVELTVAANSELSSVDAAHVASFGEMGRIASKERVQTCTLDGLLQEQFGSGIDLLSIDIEGLDLEVLRGAAFPRRPLFVVTEPSRHYRPESEGEFASVMTAKGYREVARTDYNLIYEDAREAGAGPAKAQRRRKVKTFDIFDTLIARRCVTPAAVFEEVERASGVAGFAAARRQSELDVAHLDYTLDDIYARLGARLELDGAASARLRDLELRAEADNVVPVADHIARLDEDSILITDMYLPAERIAALIERAGIPIDLPIVRTTHGKRTGSIWQQLAAHGVDCVHLGDNRHSDYGTCIQAGMRAELHARTEPTPAERRLLEGGFPHLGRMIRAVRLATPSADLPAWQHSAYFGFNLPLLVALATVVRRFAQGAGRQRILFSSRDCYFLKQVFEASGAAAGAGEPQSVYWHTSRIARCAGDPAYLDYCRSLLDVPALLVDLCGTGASLARLLCDLAADPKRVAVLLCERIDNAQLTQQFRTLYELADGRDFPVLDIVTASNFVDNNVLEMLNYTPQGMLLGVRACSGNFIPLRDELEFDGPRSGLLQRAARLNREACARLRAEYTAAARDEILAQPQQLFALLRLVAQDLQADLQQLRATFLPQHQMYEGLTLQRLSEQRGRPAAR